MALVSRAELQATLNIGTLYADAVLDQVIGSAENAVLSLLTRDRRIVTGYAVTESVEGPAVGTVLSLTTAGPHRLSVDEQVRLGDFPRAGLSGLLVTITALTSEDTFTGTVSTVFNPGVTPLQSLVPNGQIYLEAAAAFYDTISEVREAALAIAVDIFQSRVAPGGQMQAVDFTPGPYRLGRSLFTRVSGLLARWTDPGSLVG